jgi:hypothetical protein
MAHTSNHRTSVALAIVATTILACSTTATTRVPSDGLIPLGTWGGDSGGLIVGDSAMHLHVGCTYGDASGRIAVDRSGHFDVAGSYMLRAYPITIGPSVPARFTGQLDGATITITATVDDTVTHTTVVRGPVTLTLGVDPRLGPCPICRRPVVTLHR